LFIFVSPLGVWSVMAVRVMAVQSATCGPFTAQVFECKKTSSYTVRVTGSDGVHWQERQFSDFVALHNSFGGRSMELPTMPQKSFFRQHLSKTFRKVRHTELRQIVIAALNTDPLAVTPGVREFLGLKAMTSEQAVSMEEFQRLLLLSYLSFSPIDENEADDSDTYDDEDEVSTVADSVDSDAPVRSRNRIFEEESEDENDEVVLKPVISASHFFFAAEFGPC